MNLKILGVEMEDLKNVGGLENEDQKMDMEVEVNIGHFFGWGVLSCLTKFKRTPTIEVHN